jgi:hypothetical protein
MSARRRLARNSKPSLAIALSTTTLFGKPVQIEDRGHTGAKALLVDRVVRDILRPVLTASEFRVISPDHD